MNNNMKKMRILSDTCVVTHLFVLKDEIMNFKQ